MSDISLLRASMIILVRKILMAVALS